MRHCLAIGLRQKKIFQWIIVDIQKYPELVLLLDTRIASIFELVSNDYVNE